jgi:hypothetical protein
MPPGAEIERESGAMPEIMAERIIEMGLKVLSLIPTCDDFDSLGIPKSAAK